MGDNTDWLGIMRPVWSQLSLRGASLSGAGTVAHVAIVAGAGGTARAATYAMRALGLKVILLNRTPAKALELAEDFEDDGVLAFVPQDQRAADAAFDAHAVRSLLGVDFEVSGVTYAGVREHWDDDCGPLCLLHARLTFVGASQVDAVVSTVPAAAQFVVPDWVLESKPVVLDAAYKPAITALLRQVLDVASRVTSNMWLPGPCSLRMSCGFDCRDGVTQARNEGCPVIPGATMLVEQGVEQCQRWTKRLAPRERMARAVYSNLNPSTTKDEPTEMFFSELGLWKTAVSDQR